MEVTSTDPESGSTPPDPRDARTVDEFISVLNQTWVWAGKISHHRLHPQVMQLRRERAPGATVDSVSKNTVFNLLNGRTRVRPDLDLVIDVLTVMKLPPQRIDRWRTAWTTVFSQRDPALAVEVNDRLPEAPNFVGRRHDVELITRLALAAGASGDAVAVALEGMAGVGKTWLAVHVAHELVGRGWFGDARLHVNLRGFDPDGRLPADPDMVLDGFLRKLGARGKLPTSRERKITAYRERLRGRKVLILLDNAATGEQVRDLLPDVPTTFAIVTSRHRLTGLPDHATPITVDVLDEDDALDLLCLVANLDPDDGERHTLRQIAHQCGYLPQALTPIASHIRDHKDWTLADHLHALQDLVLEGAVGAALTLSYRGLSAEQQRMLRLLATAPCGDATAPAAAALADTDPGTADSLLNHIYRAHLLQEKALGRYELHDLVRAHAQRRAATDEPASKRHAALNRLIEYYQHAASAAVDLIDPLERRRRPHVPAPTRRATALDSVSEARAWLDAERTNLLYVATRSAHPDIAVFSQILHPYLLAGAHYQDAKVLHDHAAAVARDNGDRAGEAAAREKLGVMHQRTGRYDEAIDHLQRARALFCELGDRVGEARAMGNLAIVYARTARYNEAIDHLQRARALFCELGDRVGEARAMGNLAIVYVRTARYKGAIDLHQQALAVWRDLEDQRNHAATLNNLGGIYARFGRYDEAIDHHQQAYGLAREHGIRDGEARALTNLGFVDELTGHPGRAAKRHHQARDLFHDLKDPEGEAWALTNLGVVHTRLGRHAEALDCLEQAHEFFRQLDDPAGRAAALNRLGEARHVDDPGRAITLHTEAHQRASEIGDRYEQARAAAGLGHAHDRLGDHRRAQEHWRQALDLYTQLGVPEAIQIRAHLNGSDKECRRRRPR